MQAPLVSILIPSFNCARYIGQTLESVLAQSYPRIEVILVDDGSTDDTRNVIAPFLDRISYHYQPNGGLASARNTGMSLAQGDYIAWLDADDLCAKDRILIQVAYLSANPDVVAIGSNFSAFDDQVGTFDQAHAPVYYKQIKMNGLAGLFPKVVDFDGSGLDWLSAPLGRSYRIYSGNVWRPIVLGNFIHPPTLTMRKEAREHAGGLRLGNRTGADWEYIISLAKLGPMAFVDAALLEYRCHPGQMSSPTRSLYSSLDNIDLVERLLADPDVISDETLRSQLSAKLADLHLSAAYGLAEVGPIKALGHLRESWRSPAARKHIPWHLARVLMPRAGFRLLRRLRRHDPSTVHRRA
jgi:glycosyltransferase involved in cell wall biosynthesis